MTIYRLCEAPVVPRLRRLIFSDGATQIKPILTLLVGPCRLGDGCSEFVCLQCFSKLSRINKLDTQVENIKQERSGLYQALEIHACKSSSSLKRKSVAVVSVTPPRPKLFAETQRQPVTPHHYRKILPKLTPSKIPVRVPQERSQPLNTAAKEKLNLKRKPVPENVPTPPRTKRFDEKHTPRHSLPSGTTPSKIPIQVKAAPTGQKPHHPPKRRQLFATEDVEITRHSQEQEPNSSSSPEEMLRVKTGGQMTVSSEKTETKVEVLIYYPSGRKKSTIEDPQLLTFCKQLVKGGFSNPEALARAVYKMRQLKGALTKLFLQDLSLSAQKMCSTKCPSLLRNTSPDALVQLDWSSILNEWKRELPCFMMFC